MSRSITKARIIDRYRSDEPISADREGADRDTLALIAKLESVADLSDEDRDALRDLCRVTKKVPADQYIIREGDRPDHVHLMIEGWAARNKVVPNGARQTVAFLLPGDFCDLHITILAEMDHDILAITPTTVAYIPHEAMQELPLNRPSLARALWWATLVDEATLRQWIVNIGRRDAYEGLAHLLCELHLRMKLVGLAEGGAFDLPLTQIELSNATGITSVHLNRVLQRLRSEGLVTLKGRKLVIHDVEGLRRAAGFDPSYLHLKRLEGAP